MPRKTTFALPDSVLFYTTFRLLEDRPRHLTYERLEEISGVPAAWIKAFGQGRMKDPSVIRVEKLYNALADEALELPYEV
jgi:hypothetical protein